MKLYNGSGQVVANVDEAKPYAGLKWVTLGDSITKGHGADTYYHTLIAEKLGFDVVNLASGGRNYTTILTEQVPEIPDDAAIITVMAGTNDYNDASNIGEVTDTGEDGTFCGEVYELVSAIQLAHPTVPLGVITPIPRQLTTEAVQKLSAAIRGVCEHYSVRCLDLNSDSGLTNFTDGEYNGTYYTDGVHANNAGHAVIASKIEPFIRSLVPLAAE